MFLTKKIKLNHYSEFEVFCQGEKYMGKRIVLKVTDYVEKNLQWDALNNVNNIPDVVFYSFNSSLNPFT
ncbi:hypothetical protein B6I21_07195 [candidate division KSB1 bacterium 4572_119]|nr:MAG: hypothetical protein B6I21_07195 [candidate division KSB1 bacterium 4572_119]